MNTVGSVIATSVDCGLYLNAGREVAVAATKTFTSQVVALVLIALWVGAHSEKEGDRVSHKPLRVNIVQ